MMPTPMGDGRHTGYTGARGPCLPFTALANEAVLTCDGALSTAGFHYGEVPGRDAARRFHWESAGECREHARQAAVLTAFAERAEYPAITLAEAVERAWDYASNAVEHAARYCILAEQDRAREARAKGRPEPAALLAPISAGIEGTRAAVAKAAKQYAGSAG